MSNAQRDQDMCQLYRSGKTVQEIGDLYGVTRERVRQIIKPYGLDGYSGGASVTAEANRKAREAKRNASREARAQAVYGCSYAELMRINMGMQLTDHGSPAYFYFRDGCNAKKAGYILELSLPEWIAIYEKAGGVWNRGRFIDGLVLGRKDKALGYTADNLHVVTLAENSRDTQLQKSRRSAEQREAA